MGQFRDHHDPHRFTWVRGFSAMPAPQLALTEFYFGALWTAWKGAANATLYDNDDVLLLPPASPGAGFELARKCVRRAVSRRRRPAWSWRLCTISGRTSAPNSSPASTPSWPAFERAGARMLGRFVTDKSVNTFPQLPVRENVNVFVWFARFADAAAYDRYNEKLAQDARWRDQLFAPLYNSLARALATLMLEPSARSLIH